jgi:predicted site-specific integrase-resolvase
VNVKHLNQRQLADRWDVSEATLERWRSEGIGPVFLKLQGRVLYRIEDIESYETECLRKSTSERMTIGGAA